MAGIEIPAWAAFVLDVLEDAGHEAWCVGGFVRDALLGRPAADVDVATSARWTEVRNLFAARGCAVIGTGAKHGTVTVRSEGRNVEVTTYRSDGTYHDGRHPDAVSFVSSIEEDLARRDFTMNALAYHPKRGLFDPYGGARDIAAGAIRAVGDPDARLREDALRVLRAIRFSSQLGFLVEPKTDAALRRQAGGMRALSGERVSHELDGILLGDRPHRALMRYADVLTVVVPELESLRGFDQRNPHHCHDAYEHTAWAVELTRPELLVRWAALLHDLGKPACFTVDEAGVGHFYGHAQRSVELARGVLRRMRKSARFSADVLAVVEAHDVDVVPAPSAVKRMLRKLGGRPELLCALCELKRGDALAQSELSRWKVEQADAVERVLEAVLAEEAAFRVSDLSIGGRDVMALGVPAGPEVGAALEAALDAVVDERVPNEGSALCAFVRAWADERARG